MPQHRPEVEKKLGINQVIEKHVENVVEGNCCVMGKLLAWKLTMLEIQVTEAILSSRIKQEKLWKMEMSRKTGKMVKEVGKSQDGLE